MLQGWHHQGFISQIDAGRFIWVGGESSGKKASVYGALEP